MVNNLLRFLKPFISEERYCLMLNKYIMEYLFNCKVRNLDDHTMWTKVIKKATCAEEAMQMAWEEAGPDWIVESAVML